jgi:UDP-3-O-[3-hydroxymyristoyl] glucosamine N-acyltransferase
VVPLRVHTLQLRRRQELIHPTAIVDDGARVGDGTRIWHWVHVCSGASIGERCSLGQNVYVGHRVVIGNGVKIQNGVSVYDAVTLEDDVFCGPSMVFTNVFNPRAPIDRKSEYRETLVKKGATLGANCTIVCGVTIGEYAFIGARTANRLDESLRRAAPPPPRGRRRSRLPTHGSPLPASKRRLRRGGPWWLSRHGGATYLPARPNARERVVRRLLTPR